jgi:hypothetical protein
VEQRDTNQSHLRMMYRPGIDPTDAEQRAAMTIYSTLLGGSMGSRLFDEIREQRGLCYSVWAADHSFADLPVLGLGAGLDSTKCVEAYTRMREIVSELRDEGPTAEEVERARAYAAGRRVLAFENTNAVARYAPTRRSSSASRSTPTARSSASTRSPTTGCARSPADVADRLAVAVVGPHTETERVLAERAVRRGRRTAPACDATPMPQPRIGQIGQK